MGPGGRLDRDQVEAAVDDDRVASPLGHRRARRRGQEMSVSSQARASAKGTGSYPNPNGERQRWDVFVPVV